MSSTLQILVLGGILLNFVPAEPFPREIYGGCGQKDKTCYGDVDGCIENKNCTFVVTAKETSTHFIAKIQNNCYMGPESKNALLGSPQCTPNLEDFKFIILWEGEKCQQSRFQSYYEEWERLDKGPFPNCTKSPPIKNLLKFIQKRLLVKDGDIPTSLIEKKEYVIQNGGAFISTI